MRQAGLFAIGLAVLLSLLDVLATLPGRADTLSLTLAIGGAALFVGSSRKLSE